MSKLSEGVVKSTACSGIYPALAMNAAWLHDLTRGSRAIGCRSWLLELDMKLPILPFLFSCIGLVGRLASFYAFWDIGLYSLVSVLEIGLGEFWMVQIR